MLGNVGGDSMIARTMWILCVFAAAALAACTSEEQAAKDERIRAYMREANGDTGKTPGSLQIAMPQGITTDGRYAKIRGTVQNKYDETVYGVRYMVVLYEGGTPPRVLDTWQREVDTTIEPGQRHALSLDAESMYFGRSAGTFGVIAVPVRVGDKEMPPPEGWR